MNSFLFRYVFLVALLLFVSCTTPTMRDRADDAKDVISFSVGDISLGAQASVSGATAGIYLGMAGPGVFNGTTEARPVDGTFVFGLGCDTLLHFERFNLEDSDDRARYRNKTHCSGRGDATLQPYDYGRLRVRLGLILGLTLEVNLLEIADFFHGFWGGDLLGDDWNGYYDGIRRNLESP
ncbi:MAG: hypothetical protein JNM27_06255 [Leptospirales bacterium]|nr:hypothetical protein [Leptospirales bacterium]